MPTINHIVIIVDVNSIPRVLQSNCKDKKFADDDNESRKENFTVPPPYDYIKVKAVKDAVVALLCKEAMDRMTDRPDFSRVLWSFKLYNSSLEINSKAGRSFLSVNMGSIDAFEKQLDSYLDSSCQSFLKSDENTNRIQYLSASLKAVLSDLPWQEPKSELDDDLSCIDNRNAIHAFFRVPSTDSEVESFMPNSIPATGSSKNIMNEMLPKAFCRKMKDLQIQLNFLDMWSAFKNHELHRNDETQTRPMMKIAQYLSGGTIQPFTEIGNGIPLGFPSYSSLLRILISDFSKDSQSNITGIKSNVMLDENQKTIRRLQGSINGSTKVSPENDLESLRSSQRNFKISHSYAKQAIQGNLNKSARTKSKEDLWREVYNSVPAGSSRRFSDERDNARRHRMNNLQDDIPKKRKHEFEEDMESEEGYSPRDIEMWCRKGLTERTMPLQREVEDINYERHEKQNNRRRSRYSSPLLLQPQKRIRREKEEMAPPAKSRIHRHVQMRHSEPSAYSRRPTPQVDSRGRVMVSEGLRKLSTRPKDKDDSYGENDNYAENMLKQQADALNSISIRLQLVLQQPRTMEEIRRDDPMEDLCSKVKWFIRMINEDELCLPSCAQVLVSQVAKTLMDLKVRDLRKAMEKILLTAFDTINLKIIKSINTEKEESAFRDAHLQILIQFEMFWVVLSDNDKDDPRQRFVEDVVALFNIIKAYRKTPSVEVFFNEMLVPRYSVTHGKLLREIAATLNFKPAPLLNNSMDSPGSGTNYPDDCSYSSVSSCCPDDSTSQHPLDNSYSQNQNFSYSQNSQRTSMRTFLSANNPKRALMLPASKLHVKSKFNVKQQSQSTQSGSIKPVSKSPKSKKVRRNLFDVPAGRDPKDMKMLLNMASTTSSSFARSPLLFKSPATSKVSCSPRSPARPSPFFALARARSRGRSRRKLSMEAENDMQSMHSWGNFTESPGLKADGDGILCPESPATPMSKRKKTAPGSGQSSLATSGKSVVQESPEVQKPLDIKGTINPLLRRCDSLSFYSNRSSETVKSRAWERSGKSLLAARIKDSVEFNSSLTLNDLEFIPRDSNELNDDDNNSSLDIPDIKSIDQDCDISEKNPLESPIPCSSKSAISHIEIEAHSPVTNNISSLICSEILSNSVDFILDRSSRSIDSNMNTPSKRVSFNLGISTPSPAHGITTTPKSILKDSGTPQTPH